MMTCSFSKVAAILFLAFVTPVPCIPNVDAQEAEVIPPEAFLVKYLFEAGGAKDDSGQENDGTVVGAAAGAGKVNGALEFDGSDDSYVEVPGLGEHEEVTVSAWIKVTGRVGAWRAIYNVDGWSPGWVHHQFYPDNKLGFSINGNPGGGNQFAASTYGDDILDEWHHSAVVYSSSEAVVRFYLDGELDQETEWSGDPVVLGSARIGGWDGGGRGFEGSIDEVVILNIAATEEQVRSLAGAIERRSIAEYSFDDGTATDTSGGGKDATIVGAKAVTGELFEGMALEFDGSDDQYIEIPDLGSTEELTIAMWFKMTGRAGEWRALYTVNGWSEGWVHHQITPSNKLGFSINGNPGGNDQLGVTQFDASQLDTWHHSAVVYSATEKKIRFYLDGQLESETDWGGNPAMLGPARVGGWADGGRGFQGLIDNVVLWRTAATARQVAGLMGDARQPRPDGVVIAAYSFDDGTAADVSGSGNDAVAVETIAVEGMFGQALEFDGSDDVYVETPDFGEHEELTIAAWFKMTGKPGDWRVIYNVNGWSQGWVHHQIHPNNRMEYSIHSNTGGNDQFGDTLFDEQEIDVWHHSAVVYSASEGTIQFYLDGELEKEAAWGGNAAVLGEGRIGSWDGGGRGFEGALDEVIFLGFAATEREIKELMENGLSPGGIFQIKEIRYTPAIDGAADFVELTWESRNGASYAIETSTNLEAFEELTDGFESQGEETTFKHETPADSARFYRLREE